MDNKKIKVIQTDLIENVKSVIFNGVANVKLEEGIVVKYDESSDTKVHLELFDFHGSLYRNGEAETTINFNLNKKETAVIKTDVGEIVMDVKTNIINVSDDELIIEYLLLQNSTITGNFLLKVEWKNE